ncbi:MAG: phage tail protein [Pseudomonadota bacterium]
MKKAAELRAHLMERVTHLGKDPDRLIVLVEAGRIAARAGSLSFEYRYELKLVFLDYTDHADTLIVPLMAWIAQHQPELLQSAETRDQVIRFTAEIIDHEKSDVEIVIPLSERVVVAEVDGQHVATHCDEPPLPDLGGPTGWTLET